MYPARATVRVTEARLGRLHVLFGSTVAQAAWEAAGPADDQGWRVVEVPVESLSHAAIDLLRLGAEAEVIAPPELRAAFARTGAAMAERYAAPDPQTLPEEVSPPRPPEPS